MEVERPAMLLICVDSLLHNTYYLHAHFVILNIRIITYVYAHCAIILYTLCIVTILFHMLKFIHSSYPTEVFSVIQI